MWMKKIKEDSRRVRAVVDQYGTQMTQTDTYINLMAAEVNTVQATQLSKVATSVNNARIVNQAVFYSVSN